MLFSSRSEYGVRVMVELARAGRDGPGVVVPLAEVASRQDLPVAYLEHLVARLRRAGLVKSRRGARGGYLLARDPELITLAEVIEALEGAIAPIECISEGPEGRLVCAREPGVEGGCPTKLLWTRVQGAILRTLKETTVADLIPRAQNVGKQRLIAANT